jgi:hypothetical protein
MTEDEAIALARKLNAVLTAFWKEAGLEGQGTTIVQLHNLASTLHSLSRPPTPMPKTTLELKAEAAQKAVEELKAVAELYGA